VLRYGSVELYVLPRDYEVREAIEAFLNGELEKIISPKERA
jgi:predicted Fe-Mo cluster-binding NifX family protein